MNHPTLLAHDHSQLNGLLEAASSALTSRDLERRFETVNNFWARLPMHIRAEHLHLFPTVLRAVETTAQKKEAGGTPPLEVARSTIAQLQQDHDYFMRELATAVKESRVLHDEQHDNEAALLRKVQERIVVVSRRLERHNEVEEAEVYPWAGELLDRPEQVAPNREIVRELENLPPRFETK